MKMGKIARQKTPDREAGSAEQDRPGDREPDPDPLHDRPDKGVPQPAGENRRRKKADVLLGWERGIL